MDNSAPAAGTLALANFTETGSSGSDFISQDKTFDLSLSGQESGSTVVYQVSTNGGGTWTTTSTAQTNLADGNYQFRAQVTDAAGNISTGNVISVTVDATAPAAPAGLTLDPATDTGTAGDNKTSVQAVKIDGTALAGSTVTLYDTNGTTLLGSGVATGGGTFSITTSSLSAGAHTITAKATDAAGNTGVASVGLTITIDTAAPTESLAITSVAGSSSPTDKTITVSGSNSALAIGNKIQISTDGSTWTDVVQNSPRKWSFADSVTRTTNFTYQTRVIDTAANVGAIATQAVLVAYNGGTASVGASSALVAEFTGTGGTLQLTPSAGITGTVNAISVASGPVAITGSGGVTTSTGDAIDLYATGAVQANPANLNVNLNGPITGAVNGIVATQNASGSVTVTTSGSVVGQAGRGIFAQQTATGVGNILINGSGNVTGAGTAFSGIVAQNLNTSNNGDVTIAQAGNVTGGKDGIKAQTNGNGNINVTTGANAHITGTSLYGIEAFSNGRGNISVTTAAGDVITSGSVGINVYNQATSIPQTGGVTTSLISVTAYGVINSGTTYTGQGSRSAGILAGYKGDTTTTVNASVFGNVIVDNYADINAAGGDGIRAYNYGPGNTTVNDHAGTITAKDLFGISAGNNSTGKVSVTTDAGIVINSGSSAIQAISQGSVIPLAAGATVSVTARGTLHSGSHLTPGGSQPQAISAGFYGLSGVSNANINGSVLVDNFATVTADFGTGVNAYNYGNGSVTLIDEANTSVSGAQFGVTAYSNVVGAGNSGNVTINIGANATVTAGSLYGLSAIQGNATNAGNIAITTSTGRYHHFRRLGNFVE